VSAGPHRCVAQIRGDASQLSAAAFQIALVRGPALRALMHRYADSALVATAQSAVCDSLHDVRSRCARWLLEACDRVAPSGAEPRFGNGVVLRPSVTFRLTQEALGHQLNARRASVSQACAQRRDDGVISYTRGSITVLDRDALEASACSCYGIVRAAYEAVFAAP
jgi:CRP-like cAMP-binding protein